MNLADLKGNLATLNESLNRDSALAHFRNYGGEKLLHLAGKSGNMEEAQHPLDIGVDINARCDTESTALHKAINFGQVELALMLIDNDADLTTLDCHGQSPLHLASEAGQPKIITAIVANPA
jgi:ankyrin repeat protein